MSADEKNIQELDPQSAQDLTLYVQNLLTQMQSRFQTMSDTIITLDAMGNRIDDLESSINELMQQAGVDESNSTNNNVAKN